MSRIEDVRDYWESHPLCAVAIPHALYTREYFDFYDGLREANESLEFSYRLHEYTAFSGKKVLDVGCGNGYVLSKFAKEGAETFGIDITPTAVDLSKRRFEYLGLTGSFAVANAEELPFEDDTFDCVCSMGVLHHTPNTEQAIEEIYRVLRPGGRLIVMFYHRNSVLYQFNFRRQALFGRKTMQQLVNEVDGIGNPKGAVYSRAELAHLLHRFDDLEMSVGLLQGRMLSLRVGRRVPNRLLRPFASRWGWFLYAKGFKSTARP